MKATEEAVLALEVQKKNQSKINKAVLSLARAESSIATAAGTYDGAPIDLLLATLRLLRACENIDKSAKSVRQDFKDALLKFIKADAVDLGVAFGLQRPKNWNQNADQFFMKEMPNIEKKIVDLKDKIKDGKKLGIEGACRIVGAEYNKSWGKIRNDYYRYRNNLRPFREDKLRELADEYYGSFEYRQQDPKVTYEERLKTDKIAAYVHRKYAEYL